MENTKAAPNLMKIIFVIGGLLFFYYAFIKNDDSQIEVSNNKKLQQSPALQLAIINDNGKEPNKEIILLFDNLLNSINTKYNNKTKQNIANGIASAYNISKQSGNAEQLFEFTNAFDKFSINKITEFEIEEALALFLKTVYKI